LSRNYLRKLLLLRKGSVKSQQSLQNLLDGRTLQPVRELELEDVEEHAEEAVGCVHERRRGCLLGRAHRLERRVEVCIKLSALALAVISSFFPIPLPSPAAAVGEFYRPRGCPQ
jgi:hypothetical protein